MHPVELMEKRIDSAMTARDRCESGSWGDNYWSGVVASLLRQLNNYTNKNSSKETIKNLH
jgi:hypothetical protein